MHCMLNLIGSRADHECHQNSLEKSQSICARCVLNKPVRAGLPFYLGLEARMPDEDEIRLVVVNHPWPISPEAYHTTVVQHTQ